jgi:hypothetical protein
MRYRRNSDTDLRSMEREYASTGNLQLLVPINRKRRQAGMPPHPEARIRIANNALFEWTPSFAQNLMSILSMYDEIDISMYIYGLREARAAIDGDYDIEAPLGNAQDAGTLVQAVMDLTDDIQELEQQYRVASTAGIDFTMSGEFSDEYEELRSQHGVSPIALGDVPDLPEDEEGVVYFMARGVREQLARPGADATREQIGWLLQLVSRRALRIYRKLLAYGALPINEVIENDPEIIPEWYNYELATLDELADKMHIAIGEILDVTQGFGPSPEAVTLFTKSWYKD